VSNVVAYDSRSCFTTKEAVGLGDCWDRVVNLFCAESSCTGFGIIDVAIKSEAPFTTKKKVLARGRSWLRPRFKSRCGDLGDKSELSRTGYSDRK
jgi:hypothetical protein